jgi:lipid II isoglutaminyl synthase (glutamine-hydrolysing)
LTTARESAVRVGLVYPELLGTYGDRGNAVVLVQRCRWRGIPADLIEIGAGEPIPDSLDVYLFGGGEDDPQSMAAAGMVASRDAIERAWRGGAAVLAVCAGFQLIGHRYDAADGSTIDGIALIDAETRAGSGRLIGEVVVDPEPSEHDAPSPPLPRLTGFENHGGRTTLGPDGAPLGRVVAGGGNGDGRGVDGHPVDGARAVRLVGTYLHGPVLPRNPALADLLLGWVCGPVELLESPLEDRLRADRLRAGTAAGVRKWYRDRSLARG